METTRPASAYDDIIAATCAEIDRRFAEGRARKAARLARIEADPRIIARNAVKASLNRPLGAGMVGAAQIFTDMEDGTIARSVAVSRLISARIALLDRDFVGARRMVREATIIRRGAHWSQVAA